MQNSKTTNMSASKKLKLYTNFLNAAAERMAEIDQDYDHENQMAAGCGDSEVFVMLEHAFNGSWKKAVQATERKYNVQFTEVQEFFHSYLADLMEKLMLVENRICTFKEKFERKFAPVPEPHREYHEMNDNGISYDPNNDLPF